VRFTCLRWITYALALAVPALAQPTLISREMPHVELSVGAGRILGGPGAHVEREMTRLGLNHGAGLLEMPRTSTTDSIPGAFAQIHVGVAPHAMVGVFVSTVPTDTVGRAADGGQAYVKESVNSRALLVSYRPSPWIRIGAGPALHRRSLELIGSDSVTREQRLGWLGSADVKVFRRPLSYEHPPTYGYLTAQYRGAPALNVPAGSLAVSGPERRFLPWPGQRVRTSHWMIGVGVGFEI